MGLQVRKGFHWETHLDNQVAAKLDQVTVGFGKIKFWKAK
jgi:hypothetical protein